MDDEKQLELVTAAETLPAKPSVAELARHLIATGHLDPQSGKQVLELQIAWEKNESEKIFIQDFAELDFPPIQRTKKSVNSFYPPLEEIQEIIDPILRSKGFKLTFTSGEPNAQNMIPVTGILSHRLGHSRTGTIYMPIAAVNKGMNANQAMGSAVSYGERYVAKMMLNLRFIGLDDDANSLSTLLDEEREKVENSLRTVNDKAGHDCLPELLAGLRVKAIGDIRRNDLARAMEMLRFMYRHAGGKQL